MKTERLIAQVKSLRSRSETLEELMRLTNLLISLQADLINELQKESVNEKLNKRKNIRQQDLIRMTLNRHNIRK